MLHLAVLLIRSQHVKAETYTCINPPSPAEHTHTHNTGSKNTYSAWRFHGTNKEDVLPRRVPHCTERCQPPPSLVVMAANTEYVSINTHPSKTMIQLDIRKCQHQHTPIKDNDSARHQKVSASTHTHQRQ